MKRKNIIDKKFSSAFSGYDREEVDGFLDEIILEFEKREKAYQNVLNELNRRGGRQDLSAAVVPRADYDELRHELNEREGECHGLRVELKARKEELDKLKTYLKVLARELKKYRSE